MALIPDPSPSDAGATGADVSLESGLAAIAQSDYPTAIAHLEGICSLDKSEKEVLRASMGLVVAYERTGEIDKAIAICQSLSHKSQPQVKEWAAKSLANLAQRYPEKNLDLTSPNTSNSSGFLPLDQISSTATTSLQTETIENNSANSSPDSDPKPTETSQSTRALVPIPEPELPIPYLAAGEWRQAGRAMQWRPLKRLKLQKLWLIEVATAIALFWVVRTAIAFGMLTINYILVKLPYAEPIPLLYRDPDILIGILFLILLAGSPWLIDKLLKVFYGMENFPLYNLATQSPESAKMLQRYCRQGSFPLPKLGILPISAPVALTYGNLRRHARIIVSQGLLEQLADDEIATIYAGQLGHIVNWDFALMSLIMLVLQIPYTAYWQLANFADRLQLKTQQEAQKFKLFLFKSAWILAICGSSLSYGLYWLFSLPALFFSRTRIYYSDRRAAEITGNPNGLTRGLLKIAIGIADDIRNQGYTSWLLEGFDLLMPLGHRQAISLGSLFGHIHFEPLLRWDWTNPYRSLLVLNYPHPLMGDRLKLLGYYAQFWKIQPELDLEIGPIKRNAQQPTGIPAALILFRKAIVNKGLPLLLNAVLIGLLTGLVLTILFWLIGIIADRLNIWQLIWLHQKQSMVVGWVLVGISINILIQINGYFRDIKPEHTASKTQLSLPSLLANPAPLPPALTFISQPIRLTGKLLGRRGISNWLGQDLILETSTGLVKLQFISRFGLLGNLWHQSTRPTDLLSREVMATGWFRRGVTPWIDLETLRTEGGRTSRADYPIWITILAFAFAALGAYIIWQ